MNRNIPEKVKFQLRQEVNFGCPLPNCGNPMLTWHHFDPPWRIKNHHEPKGMIALCIKHHAMADQGIFSNKQLHNFKSNPNDLEFIKSNFLWFPENSIIRLGGCYSHGWCELSLYQKPLLEIKRDKDGLTKISFVLFNENDEPIAEMNKNEFNVIPKNIHDFIISASSNRIKIWYKKRKIGFELHYSRKTIQEIENIILKDNIKGKKIKKSNLLSLYKKLKTINNPKDLMPIAFQQEDITSTVIRWQAIKNMGSDGKIPFINFIKCNLFYKGRNIQMKNGKLICGGLKANYCTFNKAGDYGIG